MYCYNCAQSSAQCASPDLLYPCLQVCQIVLSQCVSILQNPGLQINLPSYIIVASMCISNLTLLLPQSASTNSLDYRLQSGAFMTSIVISQHFRSYTARSTSHVLYHSPRVHPDVCSIHMTMCSSDCGWVPASARLIIYNRTDRFRYIIHARV